MAPRPRDTMVNVDEGDERHSLLKTRSPASSDSEKNTGLDKFKHGFSLSPEMFAAKQNIYNLLDSPRAKVAMSLTILVGIPLVAFGSLIPGNSLTNNVIAIWTAWDGLLSISCLLVLAHTLPGAYYYVKMAKDLPVSKEKGDTSSLVNAVKGCFKSEDSEPLSAKKVAAKTKTYVFSTRQRLFNTIAGVILVWFLFLLGAVGPNSLVYPSWLWHPFLWGRYHTYDINTVQPAMDHICNTQNNLCLNEKEWKILSAGALSSTNINDMRNVQVGQAYASQNSIVINVLARDIKENIPALRINVESLVPLFKNVALVVFENDSWDGTREIFKTWGSEAELGYIVDVMECEGVVDCKLKRDYRDNVENYAYSSAIGEMHNYRNLAINYIQKDAKYQSYSHLLVLDVDLSVPFSPLGILHTLGLKPDHAVASTGRQPWPTAFGSFTTPYDLNGFREYNTEQTMGLENWHKRFCGITEPQERWRNECDALSPTHLIAILWNDRKIIDDDFYRVDSAFNGAVLYPIDLLRSSGAQYDKGDFGHRCEHVGFHAAINEHKHMYVDRKWDMHLMPNYPGGAAWGRAKKTTDRIMGKPKLIGTMLLTHVVTVGIFVWASFILGVYGIVPLVSFLLKEYSNSKGKRSFKTNDAETDLDEPSSNGKFSV